MNTKTEAKEFLVEIKVGEYCNTKFGRPYIGVLDFSGPKDSVGNVAWGDWFPTASMGSKGVLKVNAHVGDIIIAGHNYA